MSLNTSVPTNINDTYAVPSLPVENISNKEDKANKGIANGYAPLDGTGKVPESNLPAIDVSGQIATHNSETTSVHGITNTSALIHARDNTLNDQAYGPNTDKIVTFNQSGGGNGNEIVVSEITNTGDGYIAGIFMGWGNGSGTQWSDLNGMYIKTSVAVYPKDQETNLPWPSGNNIWGMHTPQIQTYNGITAQTYNYYIVGKDNTGATNALYNGSAFFLAPNNPTGYGLDPDNSALRDTPRNYWRLCSGCDDPAVYFTNPSQDPFNFPTSGWVPVSAQTDTGYQVVTNYLPNYGGGFSVSVGGGDNSEIGAWGFGVSDGVGADAYIEPTGLNVAKYSEGKSVFIGADKVQLDNGAKLRKGTTDAGGNKGIALECTVHYELKWEAGRLYTMQSNGTTIRSVEHCMSAPTATDDTTKGYVAGTRWVMDNGTVYVCTSATTDHATWVGKFSLHLYGILSETVFGASGLVDRRPIPYPVYNKTLFSGVRAEKRVYNRSYNTSDNFWEVTTTITQLPLVSDTYYDSEVTFDDSEEGVSYAKAPSVAFGTSSTNGLIFESADEGAKILKLGNLVIPPPAPPYAPTNATFNESFSTFLPKVGDWYGSAFASDWDRNSPSKNIFNSRVSSNVSEVILQWMQENGGTPLAEYLQTMSSTDILLRCSKRYTSWTNGASPSVEGNGNTIVEIIFYGIPQGGFGTSADTFCQGNDSRIALIKPSTINTSDSGSIDGIGLGGVIQTFGTPKNVNATGRPTPNGGNIYTNAGNYAEDGWTGGAGGNIDTRGEDAIATPLASARHGRNGGSINTSAGGGSINTRGTGSIQLGFNGTRTTLNGSADENRTITLPNATGTIALTNHTHGNLTSDGKVGSTANLPLITTTSGAITTGSFGTTANSFCQGNDSRLQNILNFRNYSFSPTVASTSDQWQATYTIPANSMGPNGKIEGIVWASCSASASAKRIRLYITNVNPNNAIPTTSFTRFTSLSTASSSIASTTVSVMRQFVVINRNSTNSQIAQPANSGGVASTTSADAFEELAYDTTQPIYIVVALQKDGTGDAYTLKAVNISVVYSA